MMLVESALRKALIQNAQAKIENAKINQLKREEKSLSEEKQLIIGQILNLALLDITEHLQLIISRAVWSEAENESLKDFLKVILELSSAAKKRHKKLEETILGSSQEFKDKQDEIRKEIEEFSLKSK